MAFHYMNVSIRVGEVSDTKAIKEMAVCTRESAVTRSRPRSLIEGFNVFPSHYIGWFVTVLTVP